MPEPIASWTCDRLTPLAVEHPSDVAPASRRAIDLVDASRQAGVINPQELAKDLARVHEQDPKLAAQLLSEIVPGLSPRDRQSLGEHLGGLLGAVAGAKGASAVSASGPAQFSTADAAAHDALTKANVASIRDNLEYGGLIFKDKTTGQYSASAPAKGTATGFDPSKVSVPKGVEVVGDYHTHGDYSEAGAGGKAVRTSDPKKDGFDSDNFSRSDRRGIKADAAGKAEYAGYLGTPSGEFKRLDGATMSESTLKAPGGVRSTLGTAAGGAIFGAGAGAALGAAQALADGRITSAEARDMLAASAQGAAVGSAYAVTEKGLVKLADSALGNTAAGASGGGAGAAARAMASKLGGAGAAGAVISAGISVYENRDGLAKGDSDAIGRVAGDTVVGAGAALGGAAAGAAIGSVVPVAGTAVGAVVGLGVGVAADYVMRAGGVDKAIGNAVSDGVDALKSAGKTVAGWFD